MVNANSKDYERICSEFGLTNLDLILKKLPEKKKERAQNNYKDGVIPYDDDDDDDDDDDMERHSLKTAGRTNDINIKGLKQKATGLNELDVEHINLINSGQKEADEEVDRLLTEFKLSSLDFVIKIQEITVEEREDALFECVLTHPLPQITWKGKGNTLEDGEKYSIMVSDHKMIHRLLIKDCKQMDKGIYSAVAGITSCSAWLVVEVESDLAHAGKKLTRRAAGTKIDLEKIAREQQIRSQKEMEKILASVKAKHKDGQQADKKPLKTGGSHEDGSEGDDEISAINGPGKSARAGKGKRNAVKDSALSEPAGGKGKAKGKKSGGKSTGARSGHTGSAPGDSDQLSDEEEYSEDNDDCTETANNSRSQKNSQGKGKSVEVIFYSLHFNVCCFLQGSKGKSVRFDVELSDSQADGTSQSEAETEENGDSTGSVRRQKHSKRGRRKQRTSGDEHDSNDQDSDDQDSDDQESDSQASYSDENEDSTGGVKHSAGEKKSRRRKKAANDPGVQFICGLSDVSAIISQCAELTCKLSSEDCEGAWFRDGKKISPDDNVTINKDGVIHKLVILKCEEEHSGKYRFEADGRKTEAMISVKDPPRFYPEDHRAFTESVIVKAGHNAIFKMHFVGHEPIKIQWFKEGEELQDDSNTKIEKSGSHSRLLLSRCQRKDTGEIKIKLKNEHGFSEAVSQLIVLDKPTPPLGPAEVTESSASCIEFKWRPPKDDGGSPVINYVMERQQVGRNTWKKIGEIPGVPTYRDTVVEHGRKYCYRVRAVTEEGISEAMETDDMQAGTLAFPGPPAPPKVDSAFDDCINISWDAPKNRGGSRILGYILEKRKKGSNLWTVVNAMDELIKEKKHTVKDVVAGMEYEFRVTAINLSGAGEYSNPSEFVFARDPKKPPGKVVGLKVTETSYSHLVLTWSKPEDKPGIQDEAKGYFVEIRQADCIEWSRCNTTPIITTSFSVKGLKSMDMYWLRVIATNDGGESVPEELGKYVLAMPSPVRPKFTNHKMKSFMVVRAGNSVRITVNFEASPRPDIMWLKDNVPVTKRVTISNSDGSSQLLIPSSERSDSGIYSILVKNLVGQETFTTEVRVTDDPKPPGPIELEENVPGTVTIIWQPSPDEKRDDRLHYTVSKLDSTKRTWTTVADRLFNNKFTVCNIMLGREYTFRVYAKNDMGISAPSESPTWGMEKKKEKFVVGTLTGKDCDLRCAPTFIVPLKLHTAPKGYECYMSCAVKGSPKPRVTWYRNHVSLNTDANYYISDTCGVCSILILCVGPKDMGEYTVIAENSLGRAECSTVLSVRGCIQFGWFVMAFKPGYETIKHAFSSLVQYPDYNTHILCV
ncbi:uncharacterized protein V6R79_019497 [Siganus canaliculatus]